MLKMKQGIVAGVLLCFFAVFAVHAHNDALFLRARRQNGHAALHELFHDARPADAFDKDLTASHRRPPA